MEFTDLVDTVHIRWDGVGRNGIISEPGLVCQRSDLGIQAAEA